MAKSRPDLETDAIGTASVLPCKRETFRPRSAAASPSLDGQALLQRKRGKSRRRRRLLLFLTCIVVAGTSVAVWRWQTLADGGAVDPAAATTRVVRRDFTSSVLATGAVKPQVGAQVRVGARVSGKVEKLRANIGDSVRAGQVIAELEKGDLQATVGQRQAELNLAKAKLAAVESLSPKEIEKAKADCERWEASLARTEQERKRQRRAFAR